MNLFNMIVVMADTIIGLEGGYSVCSREHLEDFYNIFIFA